MTASGHRARRAPWWRPGREARNIVFGLLLIAVAAYSAAATYHQGELSRDRAECQTALNVAFLEALKARDVAARESSNAQRELLAAPRDTPGRAEATGRYLASLNELDRVRGLNPLPVNSSC